MKEFSARMEKILATMVNYKHVDGGDTRFSTMAGPLANNPLVKWLGVIRRGTYQSVYEDIRWAYEPLSGFCPYKEPYSDSSDGGSSNEGSKYQENLDY